jgi:hypothetical protein
MTPEYQIKQGQHRSGWYFTPFHCCQLMGGHFSLNANCWYDRQQVGGHLNKLVGFSYLHHHWQSIRLAWRPDPAEDQFELWLYTYIRGQRHMTKIMTAEAWADYKFSLMQLHTGTMGAVVGRRKRGCTSAEIKGKVSFPWTGYTLYPYFGGDPTAPHEMDIFLDFRLK